MVSISISGNPKSTTYSMGLVNSSTILNFDLLFIELGRGSYNLIKNFKTGSASVSILMPVRIISFPKLSAKSLK